MLTSRRVAFFRRAGRFGGGRVEKPPRFLWALEQVRAIEARRYEMKIGYGDRLAIPGLAIDGQGFRLHREMPSAEVLGPLEEARPARRVELGLPRS